MRLVVLASALFVAFGCNALAQATPSREVPVGHRQPKASEVPQEPQPLHPAQLIFFRHSQVRLI